MSTTASSMTLQTGYELHWFRIDDVLGKGAFGITYLAHDINLDRQVAIKEYFPTQFATRGKDSQVQALSDKEEEDFKWGLSRFISEARTLTHFEHPNLVKVSSVFEMNNTAYMVMQYEHGKSLQQILKSRKTLTEKELKKILLPLLDGMEVMHAKGFVHRDIKPGNIFIRTDGTPVLLDFGSARQTRAMDGRSDTTTNETLTTLVSPGFAPIEQYGTKSERQGPWTDIYGMGATLYKAVLGVKPADSINRSESITHDQKDTLNLLAGLKLDGYSKTFLAAIDKALSFTVQDRPKNVAEWRQLFGIEPTEKIEPLNTDLLFDTDNIATMKVERTVPLSEQQTEKILETTLDSEAQTIDVHDQAPVLKNKKKTVALLAGCVVLSIVLVMYGMVATDKSRPDAGESGKTTPTIDALANSPTSVQGSASEPDLDESRVQLLLIHAKEDMSALRLTSPVNNNAFDKYLKVLNLDENNSEALQGIQTISDKYVAMANRAMNNYLFDKADSYLKKAEAITPEAESVTNAQAKLIEKRLEASSTPAKTTSETTVKIDTPTANEQKNETFWDQVKQWQKEQSEKLKTSKPPMQNDEFNERIRDSL